MKLTIAVVLAAAAAVLLTSGKSVEASLKNNQESNNNNNLLPTLDVAKEKPLDLDTEEEEQEGSGDLYDDEYDEEYDEEDYDDDDDDYDEEDEDYDEDEEYYDDDDDDDDWDSFDESSGDGLVYDDDEINDDDDKSAAADKKTDNSNNDLHFADNAVEEAAKKGLFDDSDLLYEYYAEDYEEDYEDKWGELGDLVDLESGNPEDVVIKVPSDDRSTLFNLGHNNKLLVSLFVVSGLASFALFTLAFVLCYWQRRSRRLNGKANLPFVIDAAAFGRPMAAPPASSIVKSYQRVPTSTKEFLSSNDTSMENPTHVLHQNSGQSQQDSEKPLLP